MKVLLIHLSDIHFQNKEDQILNRVEDIKNAVRSLVNESDNILIVISGDIAFSGKQHEYEIAVEFFSSFESRLKSIQDNLDVNYIVIPGNHDCDFDKHNDTRQLIIDTILKNEEEMKKDTLIDDCLEPQREYFNWAAQIQSIQFRDVRDKIYMRRSFQIGDDLRIVFESFNTSWMSRPEEEHGSVLFPMHFVPKVANDDADLVISLVHHPYNWIKLESADNFRSVLEARSNIIMTGHEHRSSFYEIKYLEGETRQYIQGGPLQGDTPSSFNTVLIDVIDRKMTFSKYIWNDSNRIFSCHSSEWMEIPRSKALQQDKFILNTDFNGFLSQPGVPFKHPRKPDLTLEDIYVFPDLEEISEKLKDFIIPSGQVSEYLLNNAKVVIFGPEQSGKTSLLKIMFRQYYRNKLIPIWIDGESIVSTGPKKLRQLILSSYERAYGNKYSENYINLDPSEKVLIINKLNKSELNKRGKVSLFDYINKEFGYILIASEDLIGLQEILETETCEFLFECKRLILSEFGMLTKNKLIEKWILLGQEENINEIQLDHSVKRIEESTRIILTPNLVPSFPFFILTITQSAEYAGTQIPVPFTKDEGSFGFFYEWLITYSLHNSPKRISDLNVKYRYLSEIAFHIFQGEQELISEEELQKFHEWYLNHYSLRPVDLPYRDMINDLLSANIIKPENGSFSFKYPCIYYYFIARAINIRLQHPDTAKETEKIIAELVGSINEEESEFVLLFLSYLSENPYVRDIILEVAKQTYSENEPTDLDTDLDFINKGEYKLELELPQEKPREVREKVYRERDEVNRRRRREKSDSTDFEDKYDEETRSLMKAIKIAKVMGQIAKNFATSLEGPEKYKLTEECYLLSLRAMKVILNYYSNTINEFIDETKGNIKYKHERNMLALPPEHRTFLTDTELEKAAEALAFFFTFIMSYSGVYAISRFVGTEKLYPTYDELLEKYGELPSIRLIDFAIRLDCQEHIPLDILSKLVKNLRTNYIGFYILQRLVFNRLRLYESYYMEKQSACKLVGIKSSHPQLYIGRKKIGKKRIK